MTIAESALARLAARGGDAFVGVLILTAVIERLAVGQGLLPGLLAATWGVPLLGRRRFPLLAPSSTLLLLGASLVLAPEVGHDTGVEFVLVLTAVWLLLAHNPPRRAFGAVLIATPVALMGLVDSVEELAFGTLFISGAAAAGMLYRRDLRETASHEDRVEQLERTRESALQAAAARERARIARELHDIVAHSVSVMTVQAGAARMQLGHDPRQARASVMAIEDATVTALADLDRLLGLLGNQDDAIRGLEDAEQLAAQMREAGLDVHLLIGGELRPLAGGLDLALYRILQEALTNALKHAGQVRTDVLVEYDRESVRLLITNDLPQDRREREVLHASSHGHGLIGIHERTAMYGGRLDVGPRGRRFRVEVRVAAP